MFKEFSTTKYLKQYYTEYAFYGIKHWRIYYCIFARDNCELKYYRLNKGNKYFKRKWPENWKKLHDCLLHILIEANERKKKMLYTPISIKVASGKNDAWSMFYSPRGIIVASLVNFCPQRAYKPRKQTLLTLLCYVSRTLRQCISKHWILSFLI